MAATEPILTGYGAYDFNAHGPFSDGVYRPGEDHALRWLTQGGGARPGGARPSIGHNRPPPEYMSEQLFPNLPGAPIIGSVLAPLDSFVGLNTFGLMEETNREVGGAQVSYLYGRLNEINVHPPQYSINSFESMSWSERSGYVNYLQGYLAAGTIQLQRDTLSFLQRRVDSAYAEGVRRYDAGMLGQNLSREEAIGNFMDRAVRGNLRDYYGSRGVSFGSGQYVTVNNRQYAADGSYRSGRQDFDGLDPDAEDDLDAAGPGLFQCPVQPGRCYYRPADGAGRLLLHPAPCR